MNTLEVLRRRQGQAANSVSWQMGVKSSYYNDRLTLAKQELAYRQSEIYRFIDIAELIAELCVQKGLPGGDPCWISERIMSYF